MLSVRVRAQENLFPMLPQGIQRSAQFRLRLDVFERVFHDSREVAPVRCDGENFVVIEVSVVLDSHIKQLQGKRKLSSSLNLSFHHQIDYLTNYGNLTGFKISAHHPVGTLQLLHLLRFLRPEKMFINRRRAINVVYFLGGQRLEPANGMRDLTAFTKF